VKNSPTNPSGFELSLQVLFLQIKDSHPAWRESECGFPKDVLGLPAQ
jgi:hypothetical protein